MRASGLGLGLMIGLLAATPGAAQSAEDVGKTAEKIVTKPLKDANLVKEDIPPVLQSAASAPYSLAGLKGCQQFAGEISRLTAVLGPDVDKAKPKSGQSAGDMLLGSLEKTASSLVPGSGIVRKVSGAEAHEKKVKAAVYAGWLRRAFLKGTAQAQGCRI
ncbi:hypothetical protein L6Q21_09235 [Sandaracinobacter sp. RS1-74]|uniref:hypothetical protein n=1 Tax=Sandaracinobacteroides sayramensis TaxID=2913411 RepID=UPI001EDAA569|nr:hypothetical protein [Sandaracinobacteroides sayramensis]MCG2841161.1 hypothetical protein [Sandaracinobacteroides sayramensis]